MTILQTIGKTDKLSTYKTEIEIKDNEVIASRIIDSQIHKYVIKDTKGEIADKILKMLNVLSKLSDELFVEICVPID